MEEGIGRQTIGLIFMWVLMTAVLAFVFESIENIKDFIITYVFLSLYLVCQAMYFAKRKIHK